MVFARDTGDGYAIPPWISSECPNFGMMFVRNVGVAKAGPDGSESRFWFGADPGVLASARAVADGIELAACVPDGACLGEAPRVVVAGHGVSGSVLVDNAALSR